jgi:hypothetical protein
MVHRSSRVYQDGSAFWTVGKTVCWVLTSALDLRPPLLVLEACQLVHANMQIVQHRVYSQYYSLCSLARYSAVNWCRGTESLNDWMSSPEVRVRQMARAWQPGSHTVYTSAPPTSCTITPIPRHSHTTRIHTTPHFDHQSNSYPFAKPSETTRTYLSIWS